MTEHGSRQTSHYYALNCRSIVAMHRLLCAESYRSTTTSRLRKSITYTSIRTSSHPRTQSPLDGRNQHDSRWPLLYFSRILCFLRLKSEKAVVTKSELSHAKISRSALRQSQLPKLSMIFCTSKNFNLSLRSSTYLHQTQLILIHQNFKLNNDQL